MPKPSRFNDRFAHLQQHYEATEPRRLRVEREKDKATAQVMAALNPPPALTALDNAFLDVLMGRVTDFKFDPTKIFFDDIETTHGHSRSPTGRRR